MALQLDVGEHVIRALLPRNAGIDSLHLIPRRANDTDYIAVLKEEGFRTGVPQQPVTQTDAYANLSNPLVAERASRFSARLAEGSQQAPRWVLREEVRSLAEHRTASRH